MSTCQNVEDTAKDELMPRRPKQDKNSNICLRCKTARGQIVIRHCIYCKDCFYPTVSLKFRRALAATLSPLNEGRVRTKKAKRATSTQSTTGDLLLAYSGGIGSAILLDLVWSRYIAGADDNPEKVIVERSVNRRPSIWNKIRVAYVEQAAAYDGEVERSEEIRKSLSKYQEFELLVIHIEDAFDPTWPHWTTEPPAYSPPPTSTTNEVRTPTERLKAYLAAQPTLTAVSYAISSLTQLLLQHLALSTGSTHLLLGTSLTSLSVSLIAGISQGGGFNVKEEKEQTWNGIAIARPLREVGAKECAAWLWWRRLDIVPRLPSIGSKTSIQRLTRDFIVGLERDFPSTVSTIAKTCEKLEPKGSSSGTCPLCQRPAQQGIQEWKASISILSKSTDGPPTSLTDEYDPIWSALCYSCHTSWTSRNNRSTATTSTSTPLPIWTTHRSPHRMEESEMKSSIKDFLLDENAT